MGSHACDPRPGEVRTGGPEDQGHLPRHREFEGSVSYVTGKPKGVGEVEIVTWIERYRER